MSTIKQIAYFGIATLVLKGLGFLILPISTRLLSQSQFGELNLLVSLSAVMSLLLCFGLPELLFKQQVKSSHHKKALFRDAIVISGALSFAFSVFSFLFTDFLISLLPVQVNAIDVKLLAVNLAFSAILSVVFCYFRYFEMAKQFCYLAVLQGVGQTVFSIVLLYSGWGVTGVMLSGAVASFVVMLIALWLIYQHININFSTIAWGVSRYNFLFLLSIVGSSLCVYANNGAENWFIAASVGKEKLAQYYVAVQFAVMTSFTFEPIRMWWFSRRFKELQASSSHYVFLCQLCLDCAIALCCCMLIIGPFIFSITLPSSYQLHTWLLPTLMLIVVLRHHSDLLNIGCYIKANGVYVTLINALSAGLVLTLLYIMVPQFAILGAVYALLIAQCFKSLLFFIISQKLTLLPFKFSHMCISWLFFLVLYCVTVLNVSDLLFWQLSVLVLYMFVMAHKYKANINKLLSSFFKRVAYD
jgi:O-antigen/teichoic acid export membrane protein